MTTAHVERYESSRELLLRREERKVIGSDYGTTSNTARDQEWQTESVEMRRIPGVDEFLERQTNRMWVSRAVRLGLVRRYLITGALT